MVIHSLSLETFYDESNLKRHLVFDKPKRNVHNNLYKLLNTLVRPYLKFAIQACTPNVFGDADNLERI